MPISEITNILITKVYLTFHFFLLAGIYASSSLFFDVSNSSILSSQDVTLLWNINFYSLVIDEFLNSSLKASSSSSTGSSSALQLPSPEPLDSGTLRSPSGGPS